jgi:hypothetical protein
MTDKAAQARADKLNNLMVIIKAQSARMYPIKCSQFAIILHRSELIRLAEADNQKTIERQSIDRLECANIARNWQHNPNLLQAFQTKFRKDVQRNPANHWAALLWYLLYFIGQKDAVISAADLQAARPKQSFEEAIEPQTDYIQIVNLCFDYSPTVLYDLQLLISFYSSIINS